jgi:hypothetical protein
MSVDLWIVAVSVAPFLSLMVLLLLRETPLYALWRRRPAWSWRLSKLPAVVRQQLLNRGRMVTNGDVIDVLDEYFLDQANQQRRLRSQDADRVEQARAMALAAAHRRIAKRQRRAMGVIRGDRYESCAVDGVRSTRGARQCCEESAPGRALQLVHVRRS